MNQEDEIIERVLGEHLPLRSTLTYHIGFILLACLAVALACYQFADMPAGISAANEAKVRLGLGVLTGLIAAFITAAGYIAAIWIWGRRTQAAAGDALLTRSFRQIRRDS